MATGAATTKYVRTSAQKAGLVCELIRGKSVNEAIAILQFTRKTIARDLGKVLEQLPALQRPTISSLSDEEWVAVNTIIEERTVRDLIPKLKAAGGQGIVEYPLNKIVL